MDLRKECAKAILKHLDKAVQYGKGKEALLGLFMGEVMKSTKGEADPVETMEELRFLLQYTSIKEFFHFVRDYDGELQDNQVINSFRVKKGAILACELVEEDSEVTSYRLYNGDWIVKLNRVIVTDDDYGMPDEGHWKAYYEMEDETTKYLNSFVGNIHEQVIAYIIKYLTN